LHGFASGPQSAKALYLRDRFRALNIDLQIPDLNQPDFYRLTLTRQVQQVQAALPPGPVTLIGSSLGGLAAAWVAQRQEQVQRLILLAPAFQFLRQWLQNLGEPQRQYWQTQGQREFYHYGKQHPLPLSYEFVCDAEQYPDDQLQRSLPTLILHGVGDEIISIAASRNFVAQRPWVHLIELDSNHALSNVKAEIWQEIREFCQLTECRH